MLQVNKIFDLFSEEPEFDPVIDITNTIAYKLKNFENALNFRKDLQSLIEKALDGDKDKVDLIKSYIIFNRAFSFLEDINLDQLKIYLGINKNMKISLKKHLNDSIEFFEKYEEYEKCILLKKIIDLI
jgi:hypothetical protein